MFLHLGKNVVVPIESIISIIDIDTVKKSKDSKAFFKTAEEEGFVKRISGEKVKSCVITEYIKKNKKGAQNIIKSVIYYSPISSTTLQKRANFIDDKYQIDKI